jgi:RNA polymerase sigma factor (sigma-70 family)
MHKNKAERDVPEAALAAQMETLRLDARDPADVIEELDKVSKLNQIIDEMDPRRASVFRAVTEGSTMEEVAKEWGIGRERVRQIVMKATREIRAKAHRMRIDA